MIEIRSFRDLARLFFIFRREFKWAFAATVLVAVLGAFLLPARYESEARLLVKPGITGLWQVSGRSNLDWEQTVNLDLHYVENWSPVADLSILSRTVGAVVHSSGAY